MTTGEVGTALGLIIGIAGGIGTFFGGFMADKLGKKDVRYYMWIPAFGFLIAVPFAAAVYLLDDLYLILALYAVPALMSNLYAGPTFGMTQSLAPLAMRAAASALLLFIINIIGLVLGPTTIGLLSDLFQSTLNMDDVESLRMALFICGFVYLLSCLSYFFAAKHIKGDLERAQSTAH